MPDVSSRTVVVIASTLSVLNLALMAGQVTGYVHLPTIAGFDTAFPNSMPQSSAKNPTGPQGPTSGSGTSTANPLAGPQGERGPQGPVGATGPQGPEGPEGKAGAQGAVGQTGPMGPVGPRGARGPIGPAGPAGATGATGATGPMGPSGVIAANSPLIYDANSKTISLDQSQISQLGTLDYLQFSLLNSASDAPGRLRWNAQDGTLNLQGPDGTFTLQIGQESVQRVKNMSGVLIPNGSVVRVDGSSNGRISVVLADNSTATGVTAVIGIATQDFVPGAEGYITTYGLVRDLNTSLWSAGAPVYLGANGSLTTVRPDNGRIVQLGFVVTSSATEGVIYVNPIQNFEPIIGGVCTVPGQVGTGVFAWHNLAGSRWIVVCDY